MSDRRRHGRKPDLDLAGDEIDHGGPVAAIGHVLQVGAGHGVEQLSGQMARGADAGHWKLSLPGLALA